jgi:hypothetical protein
MPDYIKPDVQIEYGKADVESDLQIVTSYFINGLNDNGTLINGGTHHISVLINNLQAAWPKLRGPQTPAWTDVTKPEYILSKFGELLRQEWDGKMWMNQMKGWAPGSTGTLIPTTDTAMRKFRDALLWMRESIGGPLLEYFGKWNTTELKVQDDAYAAVWAILHYVVEMVDIQLAPWLNHMYESGEWLEGTTALTKQFSPLDQSSWNTLFFKENNDQKEDILGIKAELLDNQTFRSVKVPWITNAEPMIKRLLSESEWVWRRGRWIRAKTFFSMYNPSAPTATSATAHTKFNDGDFSLNPLAGGTGNYQAANNVDYPWLFHALNILIKDVTSKYYQNAVFGSLKKKFTQRTLFDIGSSPIPKGSSGGILNHQMIIAKYQSASTDEFYFKFIDEVNIGSDPSITHYPLNTYCIRRSKKNYGRVLVIGDVPEDDFRLYVGLNTTALAEPYGKNVTVIAPNANRFKPMCWFGFGVRKSEDEDYQISWTGVFAKLVNGGATGAGAASGKPIAIPTWTVNSAVEGDVDFPINTNFTEANYYPTKTKDPYKKQKFTCLDLNKFDVDAIRLTVCQAMFGVAPPTDYLSKGSAEPVTDATVVTSAVSDSKEDSTATSAIPTDKEESQPVSATAAEVDKKQKKIDADKKQIKQEEQKLKKIKSQVKQPTSAVSPGADYEKKMDEETQDTENDGAHAV